MAKKPSKAQTNDFHQRLLRITIEDYARQHGLTFQAAVSRLAKEKPGIFKHWQENQ